MGEKKKKKTRQDQQRCPSQQLVGDAMLRRNLGPWRPRSLRETEIDE